VAAQCSSKVDDLAEAFATAMAQLASGVVMVTTTVDGKPWGMTISACCSVSLTPPTVLVSLLDRTVSAIAIAEQGSFGVSLLGQAQVEAARFGSVPGAPKFVQEFCDEEHARVGASATPVLDRALAHVDCVVTQKVHVADHEVFFGTARSVLISAADAPLVYHARRYRVLSALLPEEPPTSTELFYVNG
jgi:flavin reductase (DIM6/NTAB) family NADH-FMN oxidoreductase RutF